VATPHNSYEEDAEAYLQTELDAIFKVMKPDHHLLFTFYLRTGFRMQEVMYLKWADINFGIQTVRVKAKPEYGFVPKRWHERSVPLEEALLRRLEEHRKVRKASDLGSSPLETASPTGSIGSL
jgi:integrase